MINFNNIFFSTFKIMPKIYLKIDKNQVESEFFLRFGVFQCQRLLGF